jgi:hypothetical protein
VVRRALPPWDALSPAAFQESWGFSPLLCASPDALRGADLTRPARAFLAQGGLPVASAARLAFALDGPLRELGAVQRSAARTHAGCPVIGRTIGGDWAVYVDGGGAVWAQSESDGRDVLVNTTIARLATSLLHVEASLFRPAHDRRSVETLADGLRRVDPDALGDRETWWREVLDDGIAHGGLELDLDARFRTGVAGQPT